MAQITPSCRYGHGDLHKLKQDDRDDYWAYVFMGNPTVVFSGHLFVCLECGYTEFFDSDVERTKKESK